MLDEVLFRPRRLGHVNLWVDDLQRSQSFYHEVCGLTVEFWEPDLVATFLGTGNTPHDLGMIETTGGQARYGRDGLLQIPEGVGADSGLGHLAWELPNERELVDAYRRAKRNEVALDMTVDHQVAHSVYLRDPDGNAVEYYCDTVKDWRSVLHGEMELITSGWDPDAPDAEEPFTEGRFDDDPEPRTVEGAPVHPRRVTHAVLTSADPERLAAFYTSVGGLAIASQSPAVTYLRGSMDDSPYHLALLPSAGDDGGYHHVAFELDNESAVERAKAALSEAGIVPEETIDNASKTSFYLRDPDGLLSEYYYRRERGLPELGSAALERHPYLA